MVADCVQRTANKKVFRRTNGNTCKIGCETAQTHNEGWGGAVWLGAPYLKTLKGLEKICTKAAARNFPMKQVNLLRQMPLCKFSSKVKKECAKWRNKSRRNVLSMDLLATRCT